jgi:hypothetical protein
MKALISTIEPRESGYRVAQVAADNETFVVAEGLFWVDCADDVVADQFYYDPSTQQIILIPLPPPKPKPIQQNNTGTVTI